MKKPRKSYWKKLRVTKEHTLFHICLAIRNEYVRRFDYSWMTTHYPGLRYRKGDGFRSHGFQDDYKEKGINFFVNPILNKRRIKMEMHDYPKQQSVNDFNAFEVWIWHEQTEQALFDWLMVLASQINEKIISKEERWNTISVR